MNTLSGDFEVDEQGNFSSFELVQSAPRIIAKDNVLRPHRIAIGLYNFAEPGAAGADRGRLARSYRVELDLSGERTEVPELVGRPRPDLVLVNDDDLTYCKLRLDPDSLHTMRTGGLAALADPLARTLCWSSAWDMVRDGELAARDYLELAIANAPLESEIGVVQSVHRQLARALEAFADPAWAPTGWAAFADAAIEAAQASEAGSDHQFAWVHAVILAACTEQHADWLAELLSGERQLDGLVVDTDLRWALVQAMVARGRMGGADIAEHAAGDRTSAGSRAAATARALLPQAGAKAEAWASAITDVRLSNAQMRAVITGFHHPLQDELLQPLHRPLLRRGCRDLGLADAGDGAGADSRAVSELVSGDLRADHRAGRQVPVRSGSPGRVAPAGQRGSGRAGPGDGRSREQLAQAARSDNSKLASARTPRSAAAGTSPHRSG